MEGSRRNARSQCRREEEEELVLIPRFSLPKGISKRLTIAFLSSPHKKTPCEWSVLQSHGSENTRLPSRCQTCTYGRSISKEQGATFLGSHKKGIGGNCSCLGKEEAAHCQNFEAQRLLDNKFWLTLESASEQQARNTQRIMANTLITFKKTEDKFAQAFTHWCDLLMSALVPACGTPLVESPLLSPMPGSSVMASCATNTTAKYS